MRHLMNTVTPLTEKKQKNKKNKQITTKQERKK